MTSPVESADEAMPLMPVRSLHNYVYCPRLFYLQWVEGIFVPNEDTVAGSALHSRVDVPDNLKEEALDEEKGALRSIMLSSDTLGVVGTMDLLEDNGRLGRRLVDYKKGFPLRGKQGEWEAKLNDAIQLAAYALLLQEEGIRVDSASVYYAQVKKHVAVPLTGELFDTCHRFIKEARALAQTGICPPPLCHDARCFSCSAYPVCLPFETRYWMEGKKQEEGEKRL